MILTEERNEGSLAGYKFGGINCKENQIGYTVIEFHNFHAMLA